MTRKPHQLCRVQKYNQSVAGVSCDSCARGQMLAAFCLHAVPMTWLNRHAFEVATAFGREENAPSPPRPMEIPFGTKISTELVIFLFFFFFNVSELTWVASFLQRNHQADALQIKWAPVPTLLGTLFYFEVSYENTPADVSVGLRTRPPTRTGWRFIARPVRARARACQRV